MLHVWRSHEAEDKERVIKSLEVRLDLVRSILKKTVYKSQVTLLVKYFCEPLTLSSTIVPVLT